MTVNRRRNRSAAASSHNSVNNTCSISTFINIRFHTIINDVGIFIFCRAETGVSLIDDQTANVVTNLTVRVATVTTTGAEVNVVLSVATTRRIIGGVSASRNPENTGSNGTRVTTTSDVVNVTKPEPNGEITPKDGQKSLQPSFNATVHDNNRLKMAHDYQKGRT